MMLLLIMLQEAETLIADFVDKCKNLDKSLSDADLENEVTKYKTEILSHENPYIKTLLAVS